MEQSEEPEKKEDGASCDVCGERQTLRFYQIPILYSTVYTVL